MQTKLLLKKIKAYLPNFDPIKMVKACEFTKNAHADQIRASGEPYYNHPFAVAIILADMHMDEASIITALLHDTVEDTNITLEDITTQFGSDVARLVDGVTKLDKIQFQPDNIREGENFRKLLLAMSEDIRVLIVKLADRLHNMRTINFLSEEKAKRIALATMEIYAPLAERIGMQKIKNELQDLSFAKLYPEERQSIINRLEYLRQDDGSVVDKIETQIKKTITDFDISASVKGREKTPCSIWQKMKQKDISFEQLSDIIAFRVIVNDVIDCYQALGIIHAAYHMIPGSFKDYISTPKDNGYRSLHTVVVGPDKQRIEIQIRTKEMHDINEWGVAAHWGYKQTVDLTSQVEGKQFRWVRELLNIVENSESEDFLENTKLEMYEDQVFCFTPKGEIIALPKGATPVDFAYALHSDIGNTCVGSKVNGRIVPLQFKLENGDQVEVMTSKKQVPSISWERFIVTGKAKSEVQRFIRSKQKKEYLSLGKAILNKFFTQEGLEFKEEEAINYLAIFHKKTLEDLYSAVGEGTISRDEVLKVMQGKKKSKLNKFTEKFAFLKFKKKTQAVESSIPIKGMIPGMAVNFAACCHPLPGDQIVGVFHSGKGIAVHTADCDMLENFSEMPEKLIEISWDKDSKETKHIGRLKITLSHEPNSLATVCSVIGRHNCSISNLKVMNRSSDFFEIIIDIEVMGITQLTNIIASLRSKECIHHVERFKI